MLHSQSWIIPTSLCCCQRILSISPRAVHCSSEERLNLLRGNSAQLQFVMRERLLLLYAESSMERCVMSKHTGISVALHLNAAKKILLPLVHSFSLWWANAARHSPPFPNKYRRQCQTNTLFVQRQHFVYENITTIKHKATTKKQSQPKMKKQTNKSTIVQFFSFLNLFFSVWIFNRQLVAGPSRVLAWVWVLTQQLVPALAHRKTLVTSHCPLYQGPLSIRSFKGYTVLHFMSAGQSHTT